MCSTSICAALSCGLLAFDQAGNGTDSPEVLHIHVHILNGDVELLFDEEHQLHGEKRVDVSGSENIFFVLQLVIRDYACEESFNLGGCVSCWHHRGRLHDVVTSCRCHCGGLAVVGIESAPILTAI